MASASPARFHDLFPATLRATSGKNPFARLRQRAVRFVVARYLSLRSYRVRLPLQATPAFDPLHL